MLSMSSFCDQGCWLLNRSSSTNNACFLFLLDFDVYFDEDQMSLRTIFLYEVFSRQILKKVCPSFFIFFQRSLSF